MTKIYEALERAALEQKAVAPASRTLLPEQYTLQEFEMQEEMMNLYMNIDSLLDRPSSKLLQLIGSQKGEGTSTIAREFAKTVANQIGKSVLLIDADRRKPCQHHYFSLQPRNGWVEVLQSQHNIADAFHQVGSSRLYVSPSCNSASFTPEIFDSIEIDVFWNELRNRFSFIIIDSPPLADSPDGLAFAPHADGVILVLEAERTRSSVAESLKARISQVGGRIVGIVFNKRRYYIPPFIYKRL